MGDEGREAGGLMKGWGRRAQRRKFMCRIIACNIDRANLATAEEVSDF